MARKIAALFVLPLILAFNSGAAVLFLSLTGSFERVITNRFEDCFGAVLKIGKARIGLFSSPEFEDVSITLPGEKGPVFSVESIRFDCVSGIFSSDGVEPGTVALVEPILTLNQKEDGSFSLARILDREKLTKFLGRDVFLKVSGHPACFVTNGLVRFRGEGSVPMEARQWLAPDKELDVMVPALHCIGTGEGSRVWSCAGTFFHEILGEVSLQGRIPADGQANLRLRVAGVDPGQEVFKVFVSEKAGRLINSLMFKGKVNCGIEIEWGGADGPSCAFDFSGFGIDPDDLPFLFSGVEGRLVLRDGCYRLDRAVADVLGGSVAMKAAFDAKKGVFNLFRIQGEKIPCCEELQSALEKIGIGRDYRAFVPQGPVDFSFTAYPFGLDEEISGELSIRPQGASASFEGYVDPITGEGNAFPYRVHDLLGEVLITFDRSVEIKELEGFVGLENGPDGSPCRGRLVINGTTPVRGSDLAIDLDIKGRSFPVNEALMEGLRRSMPEIMALLDSLNLSGRFSFECGISQNEEGEDEKTILIDLEDASLCYDEFPIRLEHLRGKVNLQGDRIVFEELVAYLAEEPVSDAQQEEKPGRTGAGEALRGYRSAPFSRKTGSVVISGTFVRNRLERFSLKAGSQRITSRLKKFLLPLLPEQSRFLCDLEYEGEVDLSIECSTGQDLEKNILLDLVLRLDSVFGDKLSMPLEDVRGSIRLDLASGTAETSGLRLSIGEGLFIFDELKASLADDIVVVGLNGKVRHLAADTDLSGFLSPELLKIWETLGLNGNLTFREIDLSTEVGTDGDIRTFDLTTELRIVDGSLGHPAKIDKVNGGVGITVSKGIEAGDQDGYLLTGKTRDLSFAFMDRHFTDVEADIRADGDKLKFNRLKGFLHGGLVSGSDRNPIVLEFDTPRRFQGSLKLKDADFSYFMDREEYGLRNVGGRVTGTVDIRGDLDNPHHTSAEGEIVVTQGTLFELPFFGELAGYLGLILNTEPPTFTDGKTCFKYSGGSFTLTDIELNSTLMKLHGSGVANVDGVDIKLLPDVDPRIPYTRLKMPEIPVVAEIMDFIKDGLFAFKVTGPYSNIRVSYDSIVDKIFTDYSIPDMPRLIGRKEYSFEDRF